MQIEEHNNLIKLFDTYGKLLSERQYEVMDKVLNLDLGESEVAELSGYSRQAVHDAITKAKRQLKEFEQKCKIVTNLETCIKLLNKAKIEIENSNIATAKTAVCDTINIIEKI